MVDGWGGNINITNKIRILNCARSFGKIAIEPMELLQSKGFEVITTSRKVPLSEGDLAEEIKGFEVVIVGIDRVTVEVLKSVDRLKLIVKHGIGIDNIDINTARALGITICNTPGVNDTAVAELTLGLIFSLARDIPNANYSTKHGDWERFAGVELEGKTTGILGLGRIGRLVATKCRAIGMNVIGFDIIEDKRFASSIGMKYCDADEVIRNADFISIHLPLNEKTINFMDTRRLSIIKPSAFLINTSRGEIIDEEALYRVLKERKIAGAAIDVYAKEPPSGNPILALDNVISTPHIGAYSKESLYRMGMAVAENIISFFDTGSPKWVV